jgi:hypothetical protein
MEPMPGPARFDDLTARLRTPDQRQALASLAAEVVPGQIGPTDHIVAVAWATRDLERAMAAASLPLKRVARDRLLDGVVAAVRYGPAQLLLEQPDGEGRLAAYLSRYGEGVAAFYVERPRFLPPSRASRRPPRPVRTPFGRKGWLLGHEWPWGPFVVALDDKGR